MSDQLLQQIVAKLVSDARVRAAWLTGSRGRRTNDRYSDIDIWIALDATSMSAIADDPLTFVHTIVPTIMHVVAPEIAPPGGAFVGSWVPFDAGYEQVDWYLVPEDTATRPENSVMLIGDIAVVDEPVTSYDEAEATERVEALLKLALQMTANMVKHARRGHVWKAATHGVHVDGCLGKARWGIAHRSEPGVDEKLSTALPVHLPQDTRQYDLLAIDLVKEIERCTPKARVDLNDAIRALRIEIGEPD